MGAPGALSAALLPAFHPQYERRAHRSTAAVAFSGRSVATVDHSTLHHELHVLDRADVPGRITAHRDDVGIQSVAELTEMILLAEDLRVHGRGGEQCARRRHAVAHHPFDLLVVRAVLEHADIA